MKNNNKLGVALVGLGDYSTAQLRNALQQTKHCHLAGIVSGSPEKQAEWQRSFSLPDTNIYNYENFDNIASNDDIDIVYVVLPNAMHADFAVRAAKAGKHVIVEKPMATNVQDAHRIVATCLDNRVCLSVGYRLHFDPYNIEMMRLGQNEVFGKVTKIIADDSMELKEPQWRLQRELAGGGPLMNNGIYCVQAAIYITGQMPVKVDARFDPVTDSKRFNSVEEGITWEMEMENGAIARCKSSYSRDGNLLRAEAEQGWFELNPAYEYADLKGETSIGPLNFGNKCQQADQMDDFALSIINRTDTKLPGEMGLRDVEILMAIYQSARTEKAVELKLHDYSYLAAR